MRYLIFVIYKFIYKDKTLLESYIPRNSKVKEFYWGYGKMYKNYIKNEKVFQLKREQIIMNIYFKYRDNKKLKESKKQLNETFCIDGCPIEDTQPESYLAREFDTYA